MWKQCQTVKVSGLDGYGNQREARVTTGDVLRYNYPVPGVVIEGTVADLVRSGSDVAVRLCPVEVVEHPAGDSVAAVEFSLPPDFDAEQQPGAWFPAMHLVLHKTRGEVIFDRIADAQQVVAIVPTVGPPETWRVVEWPKVIEKRQRPVVPDGCTLLDSVLVMGGRRVRKGDTVQPHTPIRGVTCMPPQRVEGCAIHCERQPDRQVEVLLIAGGHYPAKYCAKVESKGGRR